MSVGLAWKSADKKYFFLVIQNYALLFLSWMAFNNDLFIQKQQNWNWNQLKTSKPNPSYFSWCSTAARRRRHYETDGMNLHKVDVI